MKNLVKKKLVKTTSWVAPAGVTNITVKTFYKKAQSYVGAGSALTESGDLYTWGSNGSGQLGVGDTTNRSVPTQVSGGLKFKRVQVGSTAMRGITFDGTLYAWGNNAGGIVGDGTLVSKSTPVMVAMPNLVKVKEMISSSALFFLTNDDDLYSLGDPILSGVNQGILGDGTVVAKSSPVLVIGGYKWKKVFANAVSGASTYAIGLTHDGDLYAWGSNNKGQLGNGGTVNRSSPTIVSGGKKWVSIHAAPDTVFAIDTAGDLYAWGSNTYGELGDGTVVAKSTPTLVLGGKKFVRVSSTNGTVFAIDDQADMYSWGLNFPSILGDNTPRSSPVLVPGGKKWKKMIWEEKGEDEQSFFAIDTSGDLYATGNNNSGQLGIGTNNNTLSSPVIVPGGKKWRSIGSDGTAYNAITEDGELYVWVSFGNGGTGSQGDGTTVAKSSPTLVSGVRSYLLSDDVMSASVSLDVVPGTTYVFTFQAKGGVTFGKATENTKVISTQAEYLQLEYNS